MSKNSEKVKRWRKHCKERIIEAMGGKWCICGYNKCQSALAFHHLDPNKKDFGLGSVRANPKNWNSIIEELRKCILVCHNCHNEIHEDITQIPNNYPKFNEDFANYKVIELSGNDEKNKILLDNCPVCNKLKPLDKINCSLRCAGKANRKIDWDNLDLEEELKQLGSVVALAEKLNVSDAAIHKRMKKINFVNKDIYCGRPNRKK